MRFTRLGRYGPVISNIGLGTLALSGAYGAVEPGDALNLIGRALDAGVSIVDTADLYDDGRVERLIGRAVAGRRQEVVVCTRGSGTAQACEASLKRLDVDAIDLYYLRSPHRDAPVEESMSGLADLVRAGKVRHVGLSDGTLRQLREASAVHPVAALGVEYSLWGLRAQPGLLDEARRLGVSVVAARPVGRGFLTGRIRSADQLAPGDWRRGDPRFHPAGLRRGQDPLRAVEDVAARLDLGAGRLALGWLLSQGDHVVPVPSTRDEVHLEMNLSASEVRLAPGIRDELSRIFPPGTADQSDSLLL
ncbi:aldo/keto reductase [Herbidospora sp. NBRC 101105]|uniref:aldo/keto reductase n=1 Tax=Herbidospora sp. NBRC 101105 TaxID=3032195 RepID=UPI0024A20900|nr:aldo/keto reductase [Herbidospora sp. NBRC 101105]GLX92964.1 oxidoreductase [Herbidospora sp. NBRC 101105]